MARSLMFTLLLYLSILGTAYADTYNIKLATYSNKENLIKKMKQLDPSLQNKLILIKENNLYKLFSQTTDKESNARRLLPLYKEVFPDAYLKKDCQITAQEKTINLSSSLSVESNHSAPLAPITKSASIIQPISNTHHVSHSLYRLVNNKTYFLCPDKIHSKSEKLLIQADFNTSDVNFTTLVGRVPPLSMPYIVQKNRLYFINNGRISPSQFSTLDGMYFEYMVLSRWMKGKKIHQMRYYNKKDDAKSYLDSIYIP